MNIYGAAAEIRGGRPRGFAGPSLTWGSMWRLGASHGQLLALLGTGLPQI